MDAEQIQAELFRWLNGSHDNAAFAEGVMDEHRTLQQSYFSLIMVTLQAWADMYDKGFYDGRNEFTCKKAKEIVTQIEFMDSGRAPFI